MGGFFVRGLTGTKVNVFIDGIRFTTSAQRGGVSTFFNLVDPAALDGIEVVRGPSSAEYGSDALGGSVQFLTHSPAFASSGDRFSGAFATSFGSADTSYGSSLSARYARSSFGLSGTLAARRSNTVRPGGGLDSHNAVTRFFDLPSSVAIDDRLPDTAFTQYGGHLKAHWALGANAHLTASYLRDQQDGGKRYDQLLGGDGNLQADLRNLMADLFYVRFEKSQAGFFDRFVLSYSFNTQREERRNQGGNGNPAATINHEPERTTANGVQAGLQKLAGRHDLTLGGDYFFEGMDAPSFGTNPATGATALRRGRVPDGARYRHGGVFLQEVFEAVPRKLRLNGAVRFSSSSLRGEGRGQPARERQAALAGRRVRPERLHLPGGGALDGGALLQRGRERQPRLPRARRDRPRHLRPDRLGLRDLEPRSGGSGSDRGHHRGRRRGEHRRRGRRSSTPRRA